MWGYLFCYSRRMIPVVVQPLSSSQSENSRRPRGLPQTNPDVCIHLIFMTSWMFNRTISIHWLYIGIATLSVRNKLDSANMWTLTLLEGVGLLAIAVWFGKIVYELWMIFYTCYLGHAMGHSIEPRKMGRWAGKYWPMRIHWPLLWLKCWKADNDLEYVSIVITGATDGIGKAYAEEVCDSIS